MVYRRGFVSALAGIMILASAGVLGFVLSNWLAAIILGGFGATVFVAGTQYDGQSGL